MVGEGDVRGPEEPPGAPALPRAGAPFRPSGPSGHPSATRRDRSSETTRNSMELLESAREPAPEAEAHGGPEPLLHIGIGGPHDTIELGLVYRRERELAGEVDRVLRPDGEA